MKIRLSSAVVLITLLATACSVPAANQSSLTAAEAGSHVLLVTPDPHAAPTATPFQPAGESGLPSGASTQSSQPGASQTASPTAVPATPTRVPYINRYTKPAGQVNILIFGSDFRPNAGYRTDVILLLSVNTQKGTAALVSFPRDLYVDIPGWTMQRLNTAQAHGGFALTQATFAENFGVRPDHYIMTNFQGFRGIIDTLGGIDVYASRALSDTCDLPQAVRGFCNVEPGTIHMNGATALWYVRARHSTSDFDRTRREQEVIQAIFYKLVSLNGLARVPELFNMFSSSVETDMGLTDFLSLMPAAKQLTDLKNLTRYFIGTGQVTSWITPDGADVLVPDEDLIFNSIIAKACYNQ